MNIDNNFFRHKNDNLFWANACVGNNGNPGTWTYAHGFIKSAEIIIFSTLKEEGINLPVDELVYPACFNLRHAIELAIKAATKTLSNIATYKGLKLKSNIENSHDIFKIWENFKSESTDLDSRYHEVIQPIDKLIISLSEADPTGQTFRYPTNTESQKHLTDVAIINFFQLADLATATRDFISNLKSTSIYLNEEYKLGTFTKNLSRDDIQKISELLPPLKTWGSINFTAIKNEIKENYNIGSKELSEAINKIKTHHQFSQNIKSCTPLHDEPNHHLERFFFWALAHYLLEPREEDIDSRNISDEINSSIEALKKSTQTRHLAWSDFSKFTTPTIQAGITALYYFGRSPDYSENYLIEFDSYLEEFTLRGAKSIRESFIHILLKKDAIPSIIGSLVFLGHQDLANHLVRCFSLKKFFPSIQ